MAYLHARADGDWTAAATWGVCNATALLDAQNANTALTTSFTTSATFTPGAITIDGIAVKVASRNSSPSGTITVRLAQGGVAVAGTTVTINVADIPNNIGTPGNSYSGCSVGWLFFKFGANVTLAAATAYTLQATTSVANQVNLFRNATANNWSRLLRTTTTAAPAAGDTMFWGGEWTAAGTKTDRTVTYNGTAATDYGSADLILASVGVSKGGTFALQTTASTNYVLRLSGLFQVWAEATVAFGASGTPLPADSTFLLEFDCAADNDFGYSWYGTVGIYAADPFGTGIVRTRLTADAAATDTSLTVSDDTGWRSGDVIVVAPTQRVVTQGETRILSGDAGASSMSITAGLTHAHAGNAAWEAQADVINVTRGITIRNVTAAACTYGYLRGATVTCEWVAFAYHGNTSRVGWDVSTSTLTFGRCAFVDCEDDAFLPVLLGASTLTFDECVMWNWSSTTAGGFIFDNGTNNNVYTFTDCCLIGNGGGTTTSVTVGPGGTVLMTGTRISGCGSGCRVSGLLAGDFEDSEFYCHGTGTNTALDIFVNNVNVRVRRCLFWRNGNEGAAVTNSYDVLFEECSFYGNSGEGLVIDDSYVEVHGSVFASETGFTQAASVFINGGEDDATNVRFQGCDFSTVTGNRIAASTDINFTSTSVRMHILLSGCFLGAATEIAATTLEDGSTLAIQRRDDVTAVNSFRRFGYGTSVLETSTVGVASPSLKMTPENVRHRFESQRMGAAVPSGKVCTFSASVRKSGAYTGAQPRLVLKANGAAGIDKDVVLDTLSVGADTWEVLTGAAAAVQEDAVLEVVVDCVGTAGEVFVDDFAASSA